MSNIRDVVVIGAGLHGLSVSLNLARKKFRVTVLEKNWVGRHSSGASAAGVRTLGRKAAEIPVSLRSMELWNDITALVGDDCGFHAYGHFRVAETDAELAALEVRVSQTRALGYEHEEVIDAHELRSLVPSLSQHCTGALIVRGNGAADPHRTLVAYRKAALAAGVEIIEGEAPDAIEPVSGGLWRVISASGARTVPHVVNAAGAWGSRVAAMVGDDIPTTTKASMMMVSERLPAFLRPVVSPAGRLLSIKQSDQGTLLIGGGYQGVPDLDTEEASVRFERLALAARTATELFPALKNVRIVRSWAGLESKTADNMAAIGPSPAAPGVFHVFGFSGHGFQLVPGVGEAVAEAIESGSVPLRLKGLAVERLSTPPQNNTI